MHEIYYNLGQLHFDHNATSCTHSMSWYIVAGKEHFIKLIFYRQRLCLVGVRYDHGAIAEREKATNGYSIGWRPHYSEHDRHQNKALLPAECTADAADQLPLGL